MTERSAHAQANWCSTLRGLISRCEEDVLVFRSEAASLAGRSEYSLALAEPDAAWLVGLLSAGVLAAAAAIRWPVLARVPGLSAGAFLLMGNAAAVHALARALRGRGNPVWEPTRRSAPVAQRLAATALPPEGA